MIYLLICSTVDRNEQVLLGTVQRTTICTLLKRKAFSELVRTDRPPSSSNNNNNNNNNSSESLNHSIGNSYANFNHHSNLNSNSNNNNNVENRRNTAGVDDDDLDNSMNTSLNLDNNSPVASPSSNNNNYNDSSKKSGSRRFVRKSTPVNWEALETIYPRYPDLESIELTEEDL